MLDFSPLEKETYEKPSPPPESSMQRNRVKNRIFPVRSEEREDVKTVGGGYDKRNLEGFFDYSPSLSYADVTYNLVYGYINATLGFSSRNQE